MAKRHSTRRKPAVRSSRHNRRPGAKVPELQGILNAFLDGLSLVRTAHAALLHNHDHGPEEYTLKVGIEALKAVHADLDGAAIKIHHAAGVRR
jgi:hypothetical protein